MAAPNKEQNEKSGKSRPLSQEHIIGGFNQLRQEQRALASKLSELEMELNEHTLVVGALKEVDPERRCYRMIGGVLVERQVKDVLPAVEGNKTQLSDLIERLRTQVINKGKELNEYREKHNIRVRGEQDGNDEDSHGDSSKTPAQGVLVAPQAKN